MRAVGLSPNQSEGHEQLIPAITDVLDRSIRTTTQMNIPTTFPKHICTDGLMNNSGIDPLIKVELSLKKNWNEPSIKKSQFPYNPDPWHRIHVLTNGKICNKKDAEFRLLLQDRSKSIMRFSKPPTIHFCTLRFI